MHFAVPKNDSVRLSICIVASVFLVAAVQVFMFSWSDSRNLQLAELANSMGGAFVMLSISFAVQSIPAFFACSVLWKIGRAWAQWGTLDFVLVVVPWSCWALLSLLSPREKTLSNFYVEGLAVCVAAPLGILLRLALLRAFSVRFSRAVSYGAAIMVAVGLWRLVPWLPE